MRFNARGLLDIIFFINPASSSAIAPAGQSVLFLDDPQTVRVVLHPGGIKTNGITQRSWLRFHSRLPALLVPGDDDPRETVEVRGFAGDVTCIVTDVFNGPRGRSASTVCVVAVPDGRTSSQATLVRLAEVDRPVLLLAHLIGGPAGQFLQHLDEMESADVEPASVTASFWMHLNAACEAGVNDAMLPWPDEFESHTGEQR